MKYQNAFIMTLGFIIVLGVIIGLIFTGTKGDIISCDYETALINYVGKSLEECSFIDFFCEQGERSFSNKCGCGCESAAEEEKNVTLPDEVLKHFCTPDSRDVEACATINIPVCGWSDPEKINCVVYPCAGEFNNGCNACLDSNILYWTEGECPAS